MLGEEKLRRGASDERIYDKQKDISVVHERGGVFTIVVPHSTEGVEYKGGHIHIKKQKYQHTKVVIEKKENN